MKIPIHNLTSCLQDSPSRVQSRGKVLTPCCKVNCTPARAWATIRSLVIVGLLLIGGLSAPAATLKLAWNASTGTVDGYKIERANAAAGPWAQIAQITAAATTYTDSNVAAATTYFYRVSAYNSAGNSDYSNVAGGGTAPTLVITTPTDLQTLATPSATVAGAAYHSSGIQSVTVNGQAATLTGTNWNASIPLATGTNTLAVIATDNSPSVNTVTQSVRVVRVVAPVASFSATPTSGMLPLVVNFTDTSTGTIASRNWNFGDGLSTNLTTTSVAHTYAAAGSYTVRLIASGPAGVSTNSQANLIVVTTPAQLAVSPGSQSFGTVATGGSADVTFTVSNTGGSALSGSVSVAAPFTIVSGGSFNLAAGATANVVVRFTPPAAGSFNTSVNFTSTGGNVSTTVSGTGAAAPVAEFSATPTSGAARLTVNFTDTSTGTIANRFWNFGDGTTLTTTNTSVTYTYALPGTNTVTLIVSGALGASTNAKPGYVTVAWFPPGDVDGSSTVTSDDVLLINEVLTGLRSANDPVFQTTGFANGDLNQDGVVNASDSLVMEQVLTGLRSYIVSEAMPAVRNSTVPTTVTICGIGFPTNSITAVTIGPPVNITVSNVTVLSEERLQILLPAGGGLGTGTVSVIASPATGVRSFGRFVNK